MIYPVKYYHDAMQGAPVLSGTPGAVIALLDACLITGFNSKTVDSLVVAGNIGTITISAGGHGFGVDDIIAISGAAPTALNTEFKVLTATSTALTFATTGIADQTATGTITVKFAPIGGWTKPFSDTNKAVYQSIDVNASGGLLRVDDTAAIFAPVRAYETMSDIDTGSNMTPTTEQQSDFGISKSNAVDASARKWALVADKTMVYFGVAVDTAYPLAMNAAFFGDIVSLKVADAYRFSVCFGLSTTTQGDFSQAFWTVNKGQVLFRSYSLRSMDGARQSGIFAKQCQSSDPYRGNPIVGWTGKNTQCLRTANTNMMINLAPFAATDCGIVSTDLMTRRGYLPGAYGAEELTEDMHLQKISYAGVDYVGLSFSGNIVGEYSQIFFKLGAWS